MSTKICMAAWLLVMPATTGLGAVTFTGATRTITVVATNGIPLGFPAADMASDAFSGLGAYDQSLHRELPSIQQPDGSLQIGNAEQHSFIGTDSVAFFGQVFGQDNAVSSGSGYGSGRSRLVLQFTVSGSSTPWSFGYSTELSAGNYTNVDSASFTIFDSANASIAAFQPFFGVAPSGVLAPESYTMTMDLLAGYGGTGTGSSGLNYNWAFNIPSPGAGALLVGASAAMFRRRRR